MSTNRSKTQGIDLALYGGDDPREIPAYPIISAAHYLKIPLGTLRSWIRGRSYPTTSGAKKFKPLITLPDKNYPLLSFMNLIEAHVLAAIRYHHNVPLRNVRSALDYLNRYPIVVNSRHPIVDHWFETDGVCLFVAELGKLVNASKDGQLAMREMIQVYLRRVEHDAFGVAARLYPFIADHYKETKAKIVDEPQPIAIDPLIAFGRPVLIRIGTPTEVIATRHINGGESVEELAEDYECETAEIQSAIRYESWRKAA